MSSVAEQSPVVLLKVEPGWENLDEGTFISSPSNVCMKEERTYEDTAAASLYADHEIKYEIALGPEVLQSQDSVPFFAPLISEVVTVKEEPSPQSVTQLMLDEQFILRRRYLDKLSDVMISVKKPKKPKAQFALQACSVKLERMPRRVLEKYLKSKSKKKVVTYYTCHNCKIKFVEQKNLKKPHTCHMCMTQPKMPYYKNEVYTIIPEHFVTEIQGKFKAIVKGKCQFSDSDDVYFKLNIPNDSIKSVQEALLSRETRRAKVKKSSKSNKCKNKTIYTASSPIHKKIVKKEVNFKNEKDLAKDLLKKLLKQPQRF